MDGSNIFAFRSLDSFNCYLQEFECVRTRGDPRGFRNKTLLGKQVSSSTLHLLLLRPLPLSSRLPFLVWFEPPDLEYRSSLAVPLKSKMNDQFKLRTARTKQT